MRSIAVVRDGQNVLVLPARDSYDRETVLFHVEDRARRGSSVEVEIGGVRWRVTSDTSSACTRCRDLCAGISYQAHRNGLCIRCGRAAFGRAAGDFRWFEKAPPRASSVKSDRQLAQWGNGAELSAAPPRQDPSDLPDLPGLPDLLQDWTMLWRRSAKAT